MKRFSFSLIFAFAALISFGQSGSGTFLDPYYGNITSNITWNTTNFPSGKVYVEGFLIVDHGYSLNISSGISVIFTATDSRILVDGTFNSIGTKGNEVLFTADFDNDGNYGEDGENWGHLYFRHENLNQSSGYDTEYSEGEIDFCVFEFAKGPQTDIIRRRYGGAIKIASENVSISNSVFRHNQSGWGGAILIGSKTLDPYGSYNLPITDIDIFNCYFYSNEASYGGGGIYFWNLSGGNVNNCVFEENNASTGVGTGDANNPSPTSLHTGGGISSVSSGTSYLINCTFINNSSILIEEGNQLFFYRGFSTATNCVFWSDVANTWTTGAITMDYCAYTGLSITGTNFEINTSNTATDGPNFTNPSSQDWTIAFISPLRDAGTTPSPTVPTDYDGNSRVGNYDIGAFEVTYSNWNGSTSTAWSTSTNWDGGFYPGSASATGDIIIPDGLSNYPTSETPAASVGSDNYLIIESQAKATLGSLTNNGTLRLESDADGTASLIMGSYDNNGGSGTEEMELYLTGGSGPYKWHYISVPIAYFGHSPISGTTLNLAKYNENSDLDEGWVAYDGYDYATGLITGDTFSELNIGQGYNYYYSSTVTYTLSGSINTKSSVDIDLDYSGPQPESTVYGFNLLGNPYSAGLDWDAIVYVDGDVEAGVLNGSYPDNTSTSIYFTQNDAQVSYVAGVLSIGGEFDGIIPPMQGFFVKTNSTGNALSLPRSAAAHGIKTSLFKGKAKSSIPLIRFSLEDGTDYGDQTVVRFNEKAEYGLDNYYDAAKMMKQEGRNYISTTIGDTEYSINGIPYPAEDSSFEIPVTLTLAEDGEYAIKVNALQNLDDYDLVLVDNTTDESIALTANTTLTFTGVAGELNDRFVLTVTPKGLDDDGGDDDGDDGDDDDIPTAIEELAVEKSDFTIYQGFGTINIVTEGDQWDGSIARISVINLAGQRINIQNGIGLQRGSMSSIEAPVTKGMYLVEIIANNRRYVGKIIIR